MDVQRDVELSATNSDQARSDHVDSTPELQQLCGDFFKYVDSTPEPLHSGVENKQLVATIRQGKLTSTPETGSFEGEVIALSMPAKVVAQLQSIQLKLPCRLENVLKHLHPDDPDGGDAIMSPVIVFAFLASLRSAISDHMDLPCVRMVGVNPEDETEEEVWFYRE